MIVSAKGSILRLLQWQWKSVIFFTLTSTIVTLINYLKIFQSISLPELPLAVVGAAIGIFVSFRTNSCYDRWWEARKLWGVLIDQTRHLSNQVIAYYHSEKILIDTVLKKQIGYVHLLRCQLRGQNPFLDTSVNKYFSEIELRELLNKTNPLDSVKLLQLSKLTELADKNHTNEYRLQCMDATIRNIVNVQESCERIKTTPFPKGYVFISNQLIRYFSWLFPFCLVEELGWLTIPINLLVCLSFSLINEVGRVLEDPFSLFWNGLPLTYMSTMIEAEILEKLGEVEIPEIPKPDQNGILM